MQKKIVEIHFYGSSLPGVLTTACHQLGKIRISKKSRLTMTTGRYALRDDRWERIKDLLPGRNGHVGVTARDNRLFIEAVVIWIK